MDGSLELDKLCPLERRKEIKRILARVRITTMGNLAEEVGVTRRTICSDVADIMVEEHYIFITTEGNGGGVSIPEDYLQKNRFFLKKKAKLWHSQLNWLALIVMKRLISCR